MLPGKPGGQLGDQAARQPGSWAVGCASVHGSEDAEPLRVAERVPVQWTTIHETGLVLSVRRRACTLASSALMRQRNAYSGGLWTLARQLAHFGCCCRELKIFSVPAGASGICAARG